MEAEGQLSRDVRRPGQGVLLSLLSVHAAASIVAQQGAPPRPSVALEPIEAVLNAFRSHAVVALGEGAHGNQQGHDFRLSLIRDSRFAAAVNDIVVEFGNARYQDLMDRFVRGDQVADESLRQVWQNTTQPTGEHWSSTATGTFFECQ